MPPANAILSRWFKTRVSFFGRFFPLTIVFNAASESQTLISNNPFFKSDILAWFGFIPIAPRIIYGTGSPDFLPMFISPDYRL